MTHTYVLLEISQDAFDEVEDKLREAGYDHAFVDGNIDMHGLALTCGDPPKVDPEDKKRWDHANGGGVNIR